MNLFFSVLKWKDLKIGQNQNFYNCILFVMKRPKIDRLINIPKRITVKLGDKERFDKEQIGVKEPFSMTNCQFTSNDKEQF